MQVTTVNKAFTDVQLIHQKITIRGWVRTRRDSKNGISFVQLYDGSCFEPLQVVVPQELLNYEEEILKLTCGCSIIVEGKLIESPGKGQSIEMQATNVDVVGWVEDPESYPVSPKNHSFEYLREVAHLRPRTNTFGAVARVRHCVSMAIHRFLDEAGYLWVHTPLLATSDCEGAGELFRVSHFDLADVPRTDRGAVDFQKDFFSAETFLTVSGQLNVEAYSCALSNVYTFGPTFRAENSNTSRHLAEFWMVEPELAFADLDDSAALAEAMLKYVCQAVLTERADDMAFFEKRIDDQCIQRLDKLVSSDFVSMEYIDAITELQKTKKKFEFKPDWGLDLQTEHERYLAEKLVGAPVVIKNYPKQIKSFYMRCNDDDKTVAAMDVLAPGVGEIIGGSQREERYDVLLQRMQECNLNPEEYQWYLDLRRYGSVPHAGFGLGLERLLGYITGMQNVRDLIPFPRTPGNAKF